MKKNKKKSRRIIALLILIPVIAAVVFTVYNYANRSLQKTLYPLKYEKYVATYCRKYKLEKSFVFAVIKCESGFQSDAVSSAGAKGLMQIMPDTFTWLKTKTGEQLPEEKLFDPETSIKYGCLLYSMFIEQFGSEAEAVAAYHAGPNNVKKWLCDDRFSKDGKTLIDIPFSSTKAYVKNVMKTKDIYDKLYFKEPLNKSQYTL